MEAISSRRQLISTSVSIPFLSSVYHFQTHTIRHIRNRVGSVWKWKKKGREAIRGLIAFRQILGHRLETASGRY